MKHIRMVYKTEEGELRDFTPGDVVTCTYTPGFVDDVSDRLLLVCGQEDSTDLFVQEIEHPFRRWGENLCNYRFHYVGKLVTD